jgi:hypothetical protein
VPWVESVSPSFRARHDSTQSRDAQRVLDSLERTRDRLAEVFPRTPGDLTVVLHGSTSSLTMSNPLMPLRWLGTSPAARRYVAGWLGRETVHVLSPHALEGRASNVRGSREMLSLSAASLYARRVILENNPDLRRVPPLRLAREVRWAWMLEGAARWFAGQTACARPAIARRLHEGRRPSFPPGYRDATLLGGTVIDLLAGEQGELATAQFVSRVHPQGPKAALIKAFGGRSIVHTEGAWRAHLARLAGSQ